MKKYVRIASMIMTAVLCLIVLRTENTIVMAAQTASAIYVSSTGLDTNSGTTQGAPVQHLEKALELVQPGGTIYVAAGGAWSSAASDDDPLVIDKSVTITGGELRIYHGGIILGAGDVTFRDISLSFTNLVRNGIIANGYSLTLDNVISTGVGACNLFCGGVTGYNGSDTLPTAGSAGSITIAGTNNFIGTSSGGVAGDIFAGSLSEYGAANSYDGSATITFESGASVSNLGTVYACGAMEPKDGTDPSEMKPDSVQYPVAGNVTIHLSGSSQGAVDGTTGGTANADVIFTQGGAYPVFNLQLQNIGSLTVASGTLTPGVLSGTPDLTIQQGAELDLSTVIPDNGTLTVGNFTGGGTLAMGQTDRLNISKAITGTTVFQTTNNRPSDKSTSGVVNKSHVYVQAGSGDGGFTFVPYAASQSNYTLARAEGPPITWSATEVTTGGVTLTDFSFPQSTYQKTQEEMSFSGLEIPVSSTWTTSTGTESFDTVPLTITVAKDGASAITAVESGGVHSVSSLGFDEIFASVNGEGKDALLFYTNSGVAAGVYTIEVSAAVAGGGTVKRTITLTVTGAAPTTGALEVGGVQVDTTTDATGTNWTYTKDSNTLTITGDIGLNQDNMTSIAVTSGSLNVAVAENAVLSGGIKTSDNSASLSVAVASQKTLTVSSGGIQAAGSLSLTGAGTIVALDENITANIALTDTAAARNLTIDGVKLVTKGSRQGINVTKGTLNIVNGATVYAQPGICVTQGDAYIAGTATIVVAGYPLGDAANGYVPDLTAQAATSTGSDWTGIQLEEGNGTIDCGHLIASKVYDAVTGYQITYGTGEKLTHTGSADKVEYVAAGHTTYESNQDGATHRRNCQSACSIGEAGEDENCSGGAGTCQSAPVCVKCSQSYGSAGSHGSLEYSGAGNVILGKCSVCKTTLGTASIQGEDGTYHGNSHEATVTKTGTMGTLTIPVTYSGTVRGEDDQAAGTKYTDSANAPVQAGSYTASITYGGVTVTSAFTVAPKDLNTCVVSLAQNSFIYSGMTQGPTGVTVMDGTATLSQNTAYTYTYDNQCIDVGSYHVTVKGVYNYTGEVTSPFQITAMPLTIQGATIADVNYDASGNYTFDITGVTFNGATLIRGADYTATARLTGGNNVADNVEAQVTVTLINQNYSLANPTVDTTVNIKAHVHQWSYQATATNIITATCSVTGCPQPTGSLTLTEPDPATLTYDGFPKEAYITGSIDGVVTPTIEYTGTASSTTPPVDAGSYHATIRLGDAVARASYRILQKSIEGTTPAPVVGAFAAMTYTGAPQTPQAEVTLNGATVTGSWSEVTNVTDQATFTASGNYTGKITGQPTGMAKAAIPVSAYPKALSNLVYTGGSQPLVSAGGNGYGVWNYRVDQGSWSTALPAATDANVTGYKISFYTNGNDNYNAVAEQTLTVPVARIAQAALTIQGKPAATPVYGDTFTLSAAGGSTAGAVTWSSSNPASAPVEAATGTVGMVKPEGSVTITATRAGDTNYLPATATWVFTPGKKSVAVQATAQDKVYNGTTAATVTGTVAAGDLIGTDTVTITGLTGNFADAAAGANKTVTLDTKAVTVSGTGSAYYELRFPVSVTATIHKADPVITAPAARSGLLYTGRSQILIQGGSTTGGTLQYALGNDATGPDTAYGTTLPEAKPAGTWYVYYTVVGDGNFNAKDGGNIAVTIGKTPLILKADDRLIAVGDTYPAAASLTYTTTGLVNGEALAGVLKTSPTLGYGTTPVTDKAGTFEITIGGATADNYDIIHTNGILTVTDKTIVSIGGIQSATGLSYTGKGQAGYTGSPYGSIPGGTYGGNYTFTYSGVQNDGKIYGPTQAVPVHAGSYTLTLSVPDGDSAYTGKSAPLYFTIGRAAVKIAADSKSVVLGSAMPALTYTVSGLAEGESLAKAPLLTCRVSGTGSTGSWPILVSGAQLPNSYDYQETITYANGVFTVTAPAAAPGGSSGGSGSGSTGGSSQAAVSVPRPGTPGAGKTLPKQEETAGRENVQERQLAKRNTASSGAGTKTEVAEDAKFITQVTVNKRFDDSDIPEALKKKGLDTVSKIEMQLRTQIREIDSDVEQTVLYDVILMYSEDGGESWIEADETHFPADGKLFVSLPVPEGTDPDTHDYIVLHMFTSTAFGKIPGETEQPELTLRLDEEEDQWYLDFYVTGLSPISIGWTVKGTVISPAAPDLPETEPQQAQEEQGIGWLWLLPVSLVVLIAIVGYFLLQKRQKEENVKTKKRRNGQDKTL